MLFDKPKEKPFKSKMLFIAGGSHCDGPIIGCKGDTIVMKDAGSDLDGNPCDYEKISCEFEFDQVGWNMNDHIPDKYDCFEPGLYIWEGTMELHFHYDSYSGESDYDIDWKGKDRPATIEDLKEFGYKLVCEHASK